MRSALSLGYLFCRAADTIADTDAIPPEERVSNLSEYQALMKAFPINTKMLTDYMNRLKEWGTLNKGAEGQLLEKLPDLVKSLSDLSKTEQALIQDVVGGVIEGMKMDLSLFGQSIENVRAFDTKKTLETYLQYIGGEPGRFWSRLILLSYPDIKIRDQDQWMRDGLRFGTGLQMVNILRDLPEDLARGRCYIPLDILKDHHLNLTDIIKNSDPERFLTLFHALIDDTLSRMEFGMAYLLVMPKGAPRLRAPVWWPLSLGLKTLGQLRQVPHILSTGKKVKVKRSEVFKTMGTSVGLLTSNWLLERSFRKLFELAR